MEVFFPTSTMSCCLRRVRIHPPRLQANPLKLFHKSISFQDFTCSLPCIQLLTQFYWTKLLILYVLLLCLVSFSIRCDCIFNQCFLFHLQVIVLISLDRLLLYCNKDCKNNFFSRQYVQGINLNQVSSLCHSKDYYKQTSRADHILQRLNILYFLIITDIFSWL